MWNVKPPWGPGNDPQAACGPGADVAAVSQRCGLIRTLTIYKLLTPWQHGEELGDAVFRIAATFPLRLLRHKNYMITGEETQLRYTGCTPERPSPGIQWHYRPRKK